MLRHPAPMGPAVIAVLLSASGLFAQDQRFENFLILPDEGYMNRQLGSTMDAEGDHLVCSLKHGGDEFDGGSVVFMRRSGGWGNTWSELDRFSGPADGGYQLGAVLAIGSDRALATQTAFDAAPEVQLYRYSFGLETWSDLGGAVTAPFGATDEFGASLAIDGDLLAVGDPGANRVYIYRDLGNSVVHVDTVVSTVGSPDAFGWSIAMSNDLLAVGDPLDGAGRVDLYRLNSGNGAVHSARIDTAGSTIGLGDEFGAVVALDGNVLAVGATRSASIDPGRLLIYELDSENVWRMRLEGAPAGGLGRFPASVDVEGGMVLAGAPGEYFGGENGAAMVYRRGSAGNWSLTERLSLLSDGINAYAGSAVALAYGEALVGTPGRSIFDGFPQATGGIASYGMDCDYDGVPDVEEIALGSEVDYDSDGVPDYCELDEYVIVPVDFLTVQAAVDGAGGRTVLLAPGIYAEGVVIDGVDVDIRPWILGDTPVLSNGIFGAPALDVRDARLALMSIMFTENSVGIDADLNARVVLEGCSFQSNSTGLRLANSELEATNCLFEDNWSALSGGTAINGESSFLTLESCTFQHNGGNSFALVAAHHGGAIRLRGDLGNGIDATDCVFENNRVSVDHISVPAASSGTSKGGAFYAETLGQPSRFEGCTFRGNLAFAALQETGGGLPAPNHARGGAIAIDLLETTLNLTNTMFEANQVRRLETFDADFGSGSFGAEIAIYSGEGAELELDFVTVRDSIATDVQPDGTHTAPDWTTVVEIREAEFGGGPIEVWVRNSHFENLPQTSLVAYGSPFGDTAVHIGEETTFDNCGLVRLEVPGAWCSHCTFIGTRLYTHGSVSYSHFERIFYSAASSALRMPLGTGVYATSFHQIGTSYVIAGGTVDEPISISGVTICGNAAEAFAPTAFWTNDNFNWIEGAPNGTEDCPGGIERDVPGDHATIDEALLEANNGDTIRLGGGTFAEAVDMRGFDRLTLWGAGMDATTIDPPEGEAGIRVNGGLVGIRDLTVSGAYHGIDADRGTVDLIRVRLQDNTGSCGAGMRLGEGFADIEGDGAAAYLVDSVVRDNFSSGDGGGICVARDAALLIESSEFTNNVANGSGGGIDVAFGARTLGVLDTTFRFNIALEDGGAVDADVAGDTSFESSSFTSNEAGRFGGGAQCATADLVDCTFTANSAGEVGGGFRSTGTSGLSDCTFQLNVAGNGGGLAATAIETYVEDFTACGNVGGDWYGNVLEVDGGQLLCSSDCNSNGVLDSTEIAMGMVFDCNGNLVPDECEDLADVDGNGIPDACDPATNQTILLGSIGVVQGLPADAVDLLARPLFRSGSRTHDVLVLSPSGDGAIVSIVPDAMGAYGQGETFPGLDFERCCFEGPEPVCVNNGPAGGSALAFGRGDVVISHPMGDTGLFDEDLQMYYGCGEPAGAGLPAPITDYDLAPNTTLAISMQYREEEEEGGLARARLSLSNRKRGQTLVAVDGVGAGPKDTAGRRGSGQGGAGPYPGTDTEDDIGLSVNDLTTGDFNGDGNDDLVLLHPDELFFTVRNFLRVATGVDEDTGNETVAGAEWDAPAMRHTAESGFAVLAGQFVEFPGEEDDGLDDVAVVVVGDDGAVLQIWASTAPDAMVQVGGGYPLLSTNFKLGKVRVASDGSEVILVAQQAPVGMSYLDYVTYDPALGELNVGWISLEVGEVRAISNAPVRFGVSTREFTAILIDTGASSSVHLIEVGRRPAIQAPENDDCAFAQEIFEGENAISNLGATDTPIELPNECESDGSTHLHADVWYTWLATCSGEVTVSTCDNANFDTWLVAYEGGCDGQVIACNDQNAECAFNTSIMKFDAVEGTRYLVRVGSWQADDHGSGVLTVRCPGPLGDINGDGIVDGDDLTTLLGEWGQPGRTDLNDDGITDGGDLNILLGEWTT